MKALSVRQPYASYILDGLKTIEIRTWSTKHRGPLLICASSYKMPYYSNSSFPYGRMICIVDLVDIRPLVEDDLDLAFSAGCEITNKDKAWILSNPRAVKTTPVKGRLHLFDVDDELVELINA